MTTLVIYVFSFIGMVVYTFTISVGYIQVVYVTASCLG
jgi:FLVCR family feline leukemia virus subgroup C receptor-related protein